MRTTQSTLFVIIVGPAAGTERLKVVGSKLQRECDGVNERRWFAPCASNTGNDGLPQSWSQDKSWDIQSLQSFRPHQSHLQRQTSPETLFSMGGGQVRVFGGTPCFFYYGGGGLGVGWGSVTVGSGYLLDDDAGCS